MKLEQNTNALIAVQGNFEKIHRHGCDFFLGVGGAEGDLKGTENRILTFLGKGWLEFVNFPLCITISFCMKLKVFCFCFSSVE